MKKLSTLALSLFLLIAVIAGCKSAVLRTIVTLTDVVDTASSSYADAWAKGVVPADVDAKVTRAHGEYRKAAGVAKEALIAYKNSGEKADYEKAFEAARRAASALINMVVPYLTAEKSDKIKTDLTKAVAL